MSMSNCYIYENQVYANSFPREWIETNANGTGYDCTNCIYYNSQYGALENYCVNCQDYCYQGTRGNTNMENMTLLKNTNDTIGSKEIFDWFNTLTYEELLEYEQLQKSYAIMWIHFADIPYANQPLLVNSILQWFLIHHEKKERWAKEAQDDCIEYNSSDDEEVDEDVIVTNVVIEENITTNIPKNTVLFQCVMN